MEGKWVAAAYMKNHDRFAAWFAGGNQQVSAIGKHANNKKNRYRVRLLIVLL